VLGSIHIKSSQNYKVDTKIRGRKGNDHAMNIVLFGATGMVGQGVLRECLLDPDV
jgi:hypothetical protein